jgi:hypothetical protein
MDISYPEITVGHFFWVLAWAMLGFIFAAAAWSQGKKPIYKDWLAGTLGTCFEAMGVTLKSSQQAFIVPLVLGLILSLLLRFLPEDEANLKITWRTKSGSRYIAARAVSTTLFILYFFLGLIVLLLAYRGWWDVLLANPEIGHPEVK